MRRRVPYILPIALIISGGSLLFLGFRQGQDLRVLAGAGLALVAGVISILVLRGSIGNRSGMVLGVVFAVLALGLAYLNYRSLNTRKNTTLQGTRSEGTRGSSSLNEPRTGTPFNVSLV